MATTYVNVPGIGSGTDSDEYRADIDRTALDAWAGNRLAGSGRFVLKVLGPQSALDSLVARADVEELSAEDAAAELNAGSSTTIGPDSGWYD